MSGMNYQKNKSTSKLESILRDRSLFSFIFNDQTSKHFVYEFKVLPSDVDQFQHMSFANYIVNLYRAKDAYYAGLGLEPESCSRIQTTNAGLKFKKQTIIGQNIIVSKTCSSVSGPNILLGLSFYDATDNELVAEGYVLGKADEFNDDKALEGVMFELGSDAANEELIKTNSYVEKSMSNEFDSRNQNLWSYSGLKIFFKHTNIRGNIHSFNYFEWSSYVREAFFSKHCDDFREILSKPVAMMTTRMDVKVFSNGRFSDEYTAFFSVSKVKKSSFDVRIRFLNNMTGKIDAETIHTLVFMNAETNKFCSIPPNLLESIKRYEERIKCTI